MAIANNRVWTVEDVRALPDDPRHRYETVDGMLLVTVSPRFSHQDASARLLVALDAYVRENRIGVVITAPSDVVLDEKTVVQPDVYVLPNVNGRRVRDEDPKPVPLLAVEVLSPASARFDRVVKRERYRRAGMEFWIVDLDARLVERWTPDADRPEICATQIAWRPLETVEPLRLNLSDLFDEVLGTPA